MKAIVAVTKNWGIGKDNKLLVSIPEDMKFFRETTAGAIVIMGRKTLESFPGGRPLKNRVNIVISRSPDFAPEGVVAVSSVDEAIAAAEKVRSESEGNKEIFVIGGASIYAQMVPLCSTVYVTKVDKICDADAYFPDLDSDEHFHVAAETEEKMYENTAYKFVTYEQ